MASQSNPLCLGEQNGTIKLSVEGGNGGFTFIRDNTFKQDSLRFTDLTQGDYTFKVTDRRACEDTVTSVRLKWPKGLTASVTPFSPTCFGDINGKIEVIASGGIGGFKAFLDKTKDAIFDSKTSKAVFQNLTAGNYTLAISDANGCQVISPATILEAVPIEPIDLGKSEPVCLGQEVTLNAGNSKNQVSWFLNGTPLIDKNQKAITSSSITIKEVGTYEVKVNNSTGCEAKSSYLLVNNANAINADFLMTVEAFVADTVFALDISSPTPSEIIWTLPKEARNLDENVKGLTYRIDTPGEYEIKMLARTDNCENTKIRTIKIYEKKDIGTTNPDLFYNNYNIISKLEVFPNPNYGKFDVDIALKTVSEIKLRITRASTGVLLYEQNEAEADKFKLNISLDRFIQDTYILTVTAGNSTLAKRILIMN